MAETPTYRIELCPVCGVQTTQISASAIEVPMCEHEPKDGFRPRIITVTSDDAVLAGIARKIIVEGDYLSVDGSWMRVDSAYDGLSEEEASLIRRLRAGARGDDPDE